MAGLPLAFCDKHTTTVLFITHDVDEALILADTVHVMSPGPGEIIASIDVKATRPRATLRDADEFVAHRLRILELLRTGEAAAPA
jgi:NitT/TauT family transport system ATP-binding protein